MANGFGRKTNFGRNPRILRNDRKTMKGDLMFVVMVFIIGILGVVLLNSIADTEEDITRTTTVTNDTVTIPLAIGETVDLDGRDFVSLTSVTNRSNVSVDYSSNVTVSDGLSNGQKTVQLTLDGFLVPGPNNSNINISAAPNNLANVSYVMRDDNTLTGGAEEDITALIIIFGAIAVFISIVVLLFKNPNFRRLLGI